MFFVGIFSVNITYIVIAIFYIFGYGTYVYNQKKNTDSNSSAYAAKKITIKTESSKKDYSDCFIFHHYSHSDHKKEVKNNKFTAFRKASAVLKIYYIHNCSYITSYNQQLPNITRPSPTI